MGSVSGGGAVTREEMYGVAWGLMQGLKGGGGRGGFGEKGEFHPDLDERQFRRVDKYKGEMGKFTGWIYEILTSIGVLNSKLQKEIAELLKTYHEEDREYKDFDMEAEEEIEKDTAALAQATEVRNKESAEFSAEEKDMMATVESLKGAVRVHAHA